MTTTLLQGDCRELLPTLPERSIQTCVTSPPYFGLRDYGADGQIGLEPTPDEYVQALVGVFREVWRVLRDDGTCWINLGDSYAANGISGLNEGWTERAASFRGGGNTAELARNRSKKVVPPGLKPKDLIGIPWMAAFALRADGWYLRSDIIWHKPNPMPESVTDRPTKAHEYIFLLSKSERYYYDTAAIAEPVKQSSLDRIEQPNFDNQTGGPKDYVNGTNPNRSMRKTLENFAENGSGSRNRRTVWTVATQPYTGAHFATFPEKLIEPCILAGSAARACEVCGAPWERVVERETGAVNIEEGARQAARLAGVQTGGTQKVTLGVTEYVRRYDRGFRPTCACPNEGTARSVVLDPFMGSGTVARVAERLCRDSIGIDLGYADLQEKRTDGVQKMMVDLL